MISLLVSARPPVRADVVLQIRLDWTWRRIEIPQYLTRFFTGGLPVHFDHSCHACHWELLIGFSIRPSDSPSLDTMSSSVQRATSMFDPPRLYSQFFLSIFLFTIGPKQILRLRWFFPTFTHGSHSDQSPQRNPAVGDCPANTGLASWCRIKHIPNVFILIRSRSLFVAVWIKLLVLVNLVW